MSRNDSWKLNVANSKLIDRYEGGENKRCCRGWEINNREFNASEPQGRS